MEKLLKAQVAADFDAKGSCFDHYVHWVATTYQVAISINTAFRLATHKIELVTFVMNKVASLNAVVIEVTTHGTFYFYNFPESTDHLQQWNSVSHHSF